MIYYSSYYKQFVLFFLKFNTLFILLIILLFKNTNQQNLNSTFFITDEWWKLNVTGNIYIRKLSFETLNTCYKYVQVKEKKIIRTNDFCYPSLIIGGIGKCGTSVIYKLLTIANNSLPASNKYKEYCLEWKKKRIIY